MKCKSLLWLTTIPSATAVLFKEYFARKRVEQYLLGEDKTNEWSTL
jgi:hypothetical protein